jgi:peptidoglycan/LPS O-acetylase OafA/YrhL
MSWTIRPSIPRHGRGKAGLPQAPRSKNKMRVEIQALRAIAVSLVVVYHFWPSGLRGGFVGVDVFFAISGFLITSQILREVDRTGKLSLASFWARRARRILPPALIVLLLCSVATFLFVPLNYWQQFFTDMKASTAYGQNWHLAANATNYFAPSNATSPVEHYWSLSAEEQFYLVWPVLILVGVWITRIQHLYVGRRAIAVGMIALTAGSLAYGVYRTSVDPAAAYFITPTRAWEFGAGGLLALVPQWDRWPLIRAAVSWAGIAAIFVAAFEFSDGTPFPGFAATLPIAGALAVMASGAPSPRWAPTPLVRLAPVQFLGDVSYGVYLWHWPLIILTPFVIGHGIDTNIKVAIILLTVLAAWLSKVIIEDPSRSGPFLIRRKARWTFGVAAITTAVVLGVTVWGGLSVHTQMRKDERASQHILASKPKCFGAASRDSEKPCNNPALSHVVVPTPIEAEGQPNSPCTIVQTRPFTLCAFGVPSNRARGTIALIGDSHASHWRAALEVVARAERWHGDSITRSGCPFSRTTKELRAPLFGECLRWNRDVPRWFERHPEVSTVFVVQDTGTKWVIPAGRDAFATEVAGFIRAWQTLPPTVKHIVVIHDTPKDKGSTLACVQQAIHAGRAAGEACKVPRRVAMERDPQATAAVEADSARVHSVNLNSIFCDRSWCYPVIGGALVHKDQHHLTVPWATSLGPYLLRDVKRLMASRSWRS